MLIAVISDSHGNKSSISKIKKKISSAQVLLFLGDGENQGKKIFMCHGHRYGVKYGYNSIFYRGKEVGADIVLFGHSHLPIIDEHDGLILMNPGSISHGVGSLNKTLGYFDLSDKNCPIAYIKEV